MDVSHEMTGTLRRETHGHEPVVIGVDVYNGLETGDKAATLSAHNGSN